MCSYLKLRASLVAQLVKTLPATQETWLWFLDWEDPLRGGQGYPLQNCCLKNPHGHRSLTGYSPWGLTELDTTEWLSRALKTEAVSCLRCRNIPMAQSLNRKRTRTNTVYAGGLLSPSTWFLCSAVIVVKFSPICKSSAFSFTFLH